MKSLNLIEEKIKSYDDILEEIYDILSSDHISKGKLSKLLNKAEKLAYDKGTKEFTRFKLKYGMIQRLL